MSETTEPELPSFDELLEKLESKVRTLESGELPLEQALEVFEEGIHLTRACHERLDAADARIIELTGE